MSALHLEISGEAGMASLGAAIARVIAPGDRIGLSGDLGAGKTTLARAVLRALADDPALEVPSPTFTIVQDYALAVPVRHVDLYRVEDEAAVLELGLGEADAAELIEWPRTPLPVTVSIAFGPGEEGRTVTVEGPPAWLARLSRELALARFLAAAGWGDARREGLKMDASTRRYERLFRGAETAVLMDAPSRRPEPGSYPVRARLADGNMDAFLAVGALLRARGLSAPATLAADTDGGFLLLEDLGDDKIAPGGRMVEERYAAAVDALAAFHAEPPPNPLPGPPPHTPPRFDADLAEVEVALFPEWYMRTPPDPVFTALWREAIEALPREDDRLALRDYHSPNCLWLPQREGVARVGVIDYQDAMIAPAAYDVVSLAQDARVDVPDDAEARLVARYLAARPGIDEARFMTAYRILGAQRATRILGVFRRLNDRDGKPQYLPHLPRLSRHLAKNLCAEPRLSALRDWFLRNTAVLEPM